MKYEIERLKGEVKISFTVDSAEWEREVQNAYNKNKFKYSVAGFRKGKVPRKVLENYYGAGIFFDDAFNAVASQGYMQVLTENTDLMPVDEPKVDIDKFIEKDGDSLVFTMTVTLKPEVTLGAYKGLTIPKAEYPVTDKDVEADLNQARERASRMVKVEDRPVQNGDSVVLDYSGSVDGVKFDGGTAEKQNLVIGSGSFIPGFEEQMIGMKIGETKDLNVKFPDDYHAEELKGKNAVFTVTVHEINVKELPELNDEFAKDVSSFDTLEEYKKSIKERLTEQNNNRADSENKTKMIETITENATVDIPDCMVEEELDYMLKDFENRLMQIYGGMKIEDYFKYTNSSVEDFKKDRRDEALKSVKTRLVLQEVIKAEKIEVTDEDVDERIKKIAENVGKPFEEYKQTVNAHTVEHIKSDVLIQKTLDTLAAANTFEKAKAAKAKTEDKTASTEKPAAKTQSNTQKTTAKKTAAKKSE